MKKVEVNKDACVACGACIRTDAEHFDWDDEGFSCVISEENLDSEALQEAIDNCPTNAILMTDGDCGCGEGCHCGSDCDCSGDNKCSSECHCGDE